MYRHQKHAQLEITQDSLENKRLNLDDLEKNEREASRLEEALGRGRTTSTYGQQPQSNGGDAGASGGRVARSPSHSGTAVDAGDENVARHEDEEQSADAAFSRNQQEREPLYTPPHPANNPPPRRGAPSLGLLHALSYTLHGMMDVDPETARRNGISKTRETISQVSSSRTFSFQLSFFVFRFVVNVIGPSLTVTILVSFHPMKARGRTPLISPRSKILQLDYPSRP